LMGLAGLGGSAVAGTNAAAQNAGNNISSAQLSAGNANASGVLGSAGAWGGAVQQLGNQGGNLLGAAWGGGPQDPGTGNTSIDPYTAPALDYKGP